MLEEQPRTKREEALENWRRVRYFCDWTNAPESRLRSDRQILIFLERWAPDAPLTALGRASLGHVQGAGRVRRRSAEAIVAPLLAIAYPEHEHCAFQLPSYAGPASPPFLAFLRGLSEHEHFELAEHWIAYLRGDRSDVPPPWNVRDSPRVDSMPHEELELALLELRLARLEVAGERLKAELKRAGPGAVSGDAGIRRARWLDDRHAALNQYCRVMRAPSA